MANQLHEQHPPTRYWRPIRFTLRTMIVALAVAAVLMAAARVYYVWSTTVPLSKAVTMFNIAARADPVGKHEPALTEEEILSSIAARLPGLNATDQVKAIYSRILRTKRLPRGATIEFRSGYQTKGQRHIVWRIHLVVMTGPESGYSLNLRDTDNPKVAQE